MANKRVVAGNGATWYAGWTEYQEGLEHIWTHTENFLQIFKCHPFFTNQLSHGVERATFSNGT